ncbi:MAG: SH3 domain-containing protein [Eubacteriales bacterium]|nr:SH3 domain-containing protein [Eubacteriales bacterium]
MKRKWINRYLGLAAIAVMGISAPVMAAETADTAVEAETGSDEAEAEETEAAEDVKLDLNGTEIILVNETDIKISAAKAEKAAEEGVYTVIVTTEEGDHKFENTTPDKWTDPKIVEEHGFLYIRYTDAEGNSKEALETADAVTPDEELTVWAVTSVNMREEASADSKVLTVVGLGDECKVVGILPGWYQVEYNGQTGFINHKFLTDDKTAADAAVEQENAAQAAAAAAAASSAAQETYSYSYSYSGSGSGSGGGSGSGLGSGSGGSGGGSPDECLTNGLLN